MKQVFVFFIVASINVVIHAMDIGSACLTREEVKQVIRQLQRDNEDMLAKMQSCGCDAALDGMQTAETVSNALPATNSIFVPAASPKPEIYIAPVPVEPEMPECPEDNPMYQMINGKCIYYEETRFDYAGAQENCGEVFEGGRLFEPTDEAENDMVYKEFKIMFGESYIRVGIDDLTKEGEFTYASNGEPVPMGPWLNDQPDGGSAQNCVVYGNYGDSKWLDYFCSGRLTSICQKTS